MKRSLRYLILIVCGSIAIGCVSVREPFPEITMYKLRYLENSEKQVQLYEGSLLIRPAFVAPVYDTEYMIMEAGDHIVRDYYHRWAAPLSDMVSMYASEVIESNGWFSEGANPESSLDLPEYALEIDILKVSFSDNGDPHGYTATVVAEFRCFDLRDPVNKQVVFRKELRRMHPVGKEVDGFATAVSTCIKTMLIEAFTGAKVSQ